MYRNFKLSKVEMLHSVQHDNKVILSDSEESNSRAVRSFLLTASRLRQEETLEAIEMSPPTPPPAGDTGGGNKV
jgi:hypothetical protein